MSLNCAWEMPNNRAMITGGVQRWMGGLARDPIADGFPPTVMSGKRAIIILPTRNQHNFGYEPETGSFSLELHDRNASTKHTII